MKSYQMILIRPFLNGYRALLIFVFLGVWGSPSAFAQYPIQVNVHVQQPVTPYLPQLLGDLDGNRGGTLTQDISDKLNITLNNTGNSPKNVKLSGRIERLSPAPMSISLNQSYSPRQPILMTPNQSVQSNKEILNQAFGYFTQRDLIFNNTSLSDLRSGGMNYKLPEGTYQICISAFDFEKPGMSAPLSAPGTGCATFIICYSASAPQITQPSPTFGQQGFAHAGSFTTFTPNSPQVQFSWTSPATTCGVPITGLSYDLTIREVFEGQTITDALFNPPVFQRQNIPNTIFVFDTTLFRGVLRSNRNYIFRVKADFIQDPNNPFEIDNQGYSQIGSFAYEPMLPDGTGRGDLARNEEDQEKDTLGKTETHIKGTLVYRFGDDEFSNDLYPLANQQVYIKRVYAKASKDANGITQIDPLSPEEQNSLPPYPEMLGGQMTETDENGQFDLKVELSRMDDAGVVTGQNWEDLFKVQYEGNHQTIPQHADPHIPDALQGMEGQLVRLYKVEVVNSFFKPSEDYIQISRGGERNLNNVVLDADSYTLNVDVQEIIEGQSSSISTEAVEEIKGAFAEGATVKLYRLAKHKTNSKLSIPYYEGDLLSQSDWKEEGDKVLIASRTTPILSSESDHREDHSVSFPRLFRSADGGSYDYIVCLEDGKKTVRMSIGKVGGFDAPVPQSSGNWQIVDLAPPGGQTIKKTSGQTLKDVQPTQRIPSGLQQSGPSVTDFYTDSISAQNELLPDEPPVLKRQYFGASDYEDKWSSWSYNEESDMAYLTLNKELIEPPHSVVTGKLEFKYKGDPTIPAQPYANKPVKLMVFYLDESGEVILNPTEYYANVLENYTNQDFPDGQQAGSPQDWSDIAGDGLIKDGGKVLQTVYTDAEGNFTFDFENIDSTMQAIPGSIPAMKSYSTTLYEEDNRGGYLYWEEELLEGKFTRVYRVIPGVNQYTAPEEDVAVQPWEDFDCGTLTSFVRTFNLEVAVKIDEEILEQNDVPVQLYFNPDSNPQFDNPQKTGVDLNKPMEVNGENYILLRQDIATDFREDTIFRSLGEASRARIEDFIGQTGGPGSVADDDVFNIKSVLFKDLVVSQDAGDYEKYFYIEAGGFPMERRGEITLESDYIFYPEKKFTDNIDGLDNYSAEGNLNDFFTGEIARLEKNILFNSELDPDRTERVYLRPTLAKPRIAGRLIDDFTTLGVPDALVTLHVKRTESVGDGQNINEDYKYYTSSDEYGYFDFTGLTRELMERGDQIDIDYNKYVINAPGYSTETVSVPQRMHSGEQVYQDPILLKPECNGCFGYVADADDPDQPVVARVKVLQNGRWVDTYREVDYEGIMQGIMDKNRDFGDIIDDSYLNQDRLKTDMGGLLPGAGGGGVLGPAFGTTIGSTMQNAVANRIAGNPNVIEADFRPQLGGQTGAQLMNNSTSQMSVGADMRGGPNTSVFDPYDPPGDGEWMTFGGVRVKVNESGKIAEAELVEGTENPGMWTNYVNAVNGVSTPSLQVNPNYLSERDYVQRFDLPLPLKSEPTKIVILPYDRSYIPDTVEVNTQDDTFLGKFLLKRRKHKIRVRLNMSTGKNDIPIGAIVSIEGVEEEQVVDERGEAYFEFVNNSTSNFTLRVKPQKQKFVEETIEAQLPGISLSFDAQAAHGLGIDETSSEGEQDPTIFVPKTLTFSNDDDNVEHVVEVEVEEGGSISGQVVFEHDQSPVENAVVYLDQGHGIQTDIITVTDEQGYYVLAGIPFQQQNADGQVNYEELKVGASYADNIHTYVGEVKNVPLEQADDLVNLTIKEIDDVDITQLLGMPVRLTGAEREGENGYKLSGEFYSLPGNPNFSESKGSSKSILSFNEVSIIPSEILNENGIPLATPISNEIPLDNRSYSLKVFEVFNGEMTAKHSNEKLKMEKQDSDTSGVLKGAVHIVDNSFNFPSSYMTVSNTDFFLGNYGSGTTSMSGGEEIVTARLREENADSKMEEATIGGGLSSSVVLGAKTFIDKLIIPVFSSDEYELNRFSLSDIDGEGIHFNYLGFDGTTGNEGNRESYIHGDSVNLYLNLHARVQGGIELDLNAGKAVLTHNEMKQVSNDDTLYMKLEEWEVMSSSWILSPTSGGIVLNNGTLNTGVVELPFSDMSIIPGDPEGELICNSLDGTALKEAAAEGKLLLGGGAAELRLYDDIDVVFVYDPDVGTTPGEGHYKFSLHSILGNVAYFGGLEGMTNANDRFEIEFVSSLSNGEQLFAFDGDMDPITYYNQLRFVPQRLFNYKDNFSLGGLVSMDVPDMPKNIGWTLRYDYTGEDDIRNELMSSPVDFNFIGDGGSKFRVDMNYEDLQRMEKEVVAFPGVVTLPNSDVEFHANFVSIAYEGAQDLIPATGKADVAYSEPFLHNNYAYSSGGVQSAGRNLYSYLGQDNQSLLWVPLAEDNPDLKTQTEIFIGTSDQLFGDAAKFLTGSRSSMNSYGSGTSGTLNDMANEVYNEASGMVNDLNDRSRQAYNNILGQVNSLRIEAHRAYDQVADRLDELRVNGEEAYEQVYNEILEELDDLTTHVDDLYDDVVAKRDEFINQGDKAFNDIYDEVSETAGGVQTNAEEIYDNLTSEITDNINEFQNYAEGAYARVADKADELRGMGDELYDELYNELSGTFNDLRSRGDEINREITGVVNDFRDYGTQLYSDATESIEEVMNKGEEVLDDMLAEADEFRQQAEDAYNEVADQIESLKAQGKEAYAAAQEEILVHLDDLRSQGEDIYNELQAKKEEWMQQGQDVIDGITDQVDDLKAYGRAMYDDLYGPISEKATELQDYAESLYGGVEDQINSIKNMGKDIYDEVYGEIAGTIEDYKSYGEDIYNEVEEFIDGYRSYGEDLYNEIYGSISGAVDEYREYMEGIAGDAVEYGEELINDLAEPFTDILDEMNGIRNTAEQYISMGKQKIDDLAGEWPLAGQVVDAVKDFDGNDIQGSLLRMAGDMVDFDGIKENLEDKLTLVANETVEGIKESLEIDQISESGDLASNDAFKGMNIDLDLKTGSITGSMYSDYLNFGAVDLYDLGIEVRMDLEGWYLYTGAGIDMPTTTPLNPIIFPIGVGFLVGMHDISPSLETRVTQHSYMNRLPSSMRNEISGFFLTGKKDILRPTSLEVNLAVVDFEIGASAGLDARLSGQFTGDGTEIKLGMMAFADAYARLEIAGTCGVSGTADANVGILAGFSNSPAGSQISAGACASVSIAGNAWCGSGPLKVEASYSESIMALLSLCAGSACREAISMDLQFGSSCSESSDFDY